MAGGGVLPKWFSDQKATFNVGDMVSNLGPENAQEKEKATHFSMLAWEIPWTEKPGRLQSMGSQS